MGGGRDGRDTLELAELLLGSLGGNLDVEDVEADSLGKGSGCCEKRKKNDREKNENKNKR